MYEAAAGHSTLGIPKSVGKEFVASDRPGKLPEYKRADGGHADNDPVARALRLIRQPRAGGGYAPEVPFEERREASNIAHPYGFQVGLGGGRTDKNPADVGAGSYVLPADFVAGIGEGNSLAGPRIWDSVLHSMPHGIEEPQQGIGHRGLPRPPSDPELEKGLFEGTEASPISPTMADGGKTESEPKVPIIVADGEILASPDDMAKIGAFYWPHGKKATREAQIKHGHEVTDRAVKIVRGRAIVHMESLPGPVGSKNAKEGHIRPDPDKTATA